MTKCYGKGCTKQMTCYRVIAPPESGQAFFNKSPGKDGNCKYYQDKRVPETWEPDMKSSYRYDYKRERQIDEYFKHLEEQGA